MIRRDRYGVETALLAGEAPRRRDRQLRGRSPGQGFRGASLAGVRKVPCVAYGLAGAVALSHISLVSLLGF